MQKNENPIVLSVVLFVISAVVALLLAYANSVTKDTIAENRLKEQNAAKQVVLASAETFEEVTYQDDSGLVKAVFTGKDASGKVVGWCVNVAPNGYGGALDIMVGVQADHTISGVEVVSHSETAGLGAKAQDPAFSSQFAGKKTDLPLSVIKNGTPKNSEIVAISGATITSNAVKDGVNAATAAVRGLNGGAQ